MPYPHVTQFETLAEHRRVALAAIAAEARRTRGRKAPIRLVRRRRPADCAAGA